MSFEIIEDAKLIIKPDKGYFLKSLWIEATAVFLFFLVKLLKEEPVEIPTVFLILLAIIYEMFAIRMRFDMGSTYILDEQGITRKFWKYEKFFFWGQFATKRVEHEIGTLEYMVIFSTDILPKKNNYPVKDYYYPMLKTIGFYFTTDNTKQEKTMKKNFWDADACTVNYDIFMRKMKDWNVHIEMPPGI